MLCWWLGDRPHQAGATEWCHWGTGRGGGGGTLQRLAGHSGQPWGEDGAVCGVTTRRCAAASWAPTACSIAAGSSPSCARARPPSPLTHLLATRTARCEARGARAGSRNCISVKGTRIGAHHAKSVLYSSYIPCIVQLRMFTGKTNSIMTGCPNNWLESGFECCHSCTCCVPGHSWQRCER